jgi:hypothetical protein
VDGLKLWKIFGEKQVVIRTSGEGMDEQGRNFPLLYLGYFVDTDDKFLYLSPTMDYSNIATALELDTIDEISLYFEEEKPNEKAKVLSLAPPAPKDSQDPA